MSCPTAANTRLSHALITDAAELERLRPAWRELLAHSSSNEPVLTPEWLLTWWRVFGPLEGRQLSVVLFCDAGRLVGLAPLVRRRHWYRPGIPFRRVEWLASGEREADEVCSDYLNVVAETGAEVRVAEALAAVLAGGVLGAWDEVVLSRMDGDGPLPGLLTEAFRCAGLCAEVAITDEAPYIPLPATWEGYLKALPQRHRYLVTRSLRDFEAWAGGPPRLERVGSLTDLERGKRILVDLHHQRWQQAGLPGVFHSPRFLAFHDAVMPLLLAEGALDLVWLSVRGQPVAALYNIVWNRKVYFYQSGRRTDVPRHVRPGIVVLAQAIRTSIEARRREFDFLAGACRSKGELALASRPVAQVRVVREGLRERARVLAERGRGLARAFRGRLRKGLSGLPASSARSRPT